MNALVTGGTGFIGSHLIPRLVDRGWNVRCLARDEMNADAVRSASVELIRGDLTHGIDWIMALDGIDVVFHLAGVTRARSTADYYEGNVMATRSIARACAAHRPRLRRFVHVSSQAAAGPAREGRAIDEASPCRPVSHYGRSKLLGEAEVLAVRDRIPITIVRPVAVYGPRDREFLAYFRMVKHHLRPIVGWRPGRLSLIHCADLAEGVLLAGANDRAEDQIYFLSGERDCTTEEISLLIATAMRARTISLRLPGPLVQAAGALSEVAARLARRSALFNRQKAWELVQQAWLCSSAKARRELGFRPAIGLEEGVASTLAWYQGAGWI